MHKLVRGFLRGASLFLCLCWPSSIFTCLVNHHNEMKLNGVICDPSRTKCVTAADTAIVGRGSKAQIESSRGWGALVAPEPLTFAFLLASPAFNPVPTFVEPVRDAVEANLENPVRGDGLHGAGGRRVRLVVQVVPPHVRLQCRKSFAGRTYSYRNASYVCGTVTCSWVGHRQLTLRSVHAPEPDLGSVFPKPQEFSSQLILVRAILSVIQMELWTHQSVLRGRPPCELQFLRPRDVD